MNYPHTIPHGIMFHHFHGERHPKGQGSISGSEFKSILRFVGVDRILDPHAWMSRLETGCLENGDLCLTLDDALLSQFDIALPILEQYHLKAFWFVYSSPFEGSPSKFEIYRAFRCRYFKTIDDFYGMFFDTIAHSEFDKKAKKVIANTDITPVQKAYPVYSVNDIRFRLIRDQVLTLEEYEHIMDDMIQKHGLRIENISKNLWMTNEHLKYLTDHEHAVGLHSYSHPMTLGTLPYEVQKKEYTRNYDHIRSVCGAPPLAMAHPANSYNEATLDILKHLGVQCGFRANMSAPREGEPLNRTPYELAREDHANIIKMLII